MESQRRRRHLGHRYLPRGTPWKKSKEGAPFIFLDGGFSSGTGATRHRRRGGGRPCEQPCGPAFRPALGPTFRVARAIRLSPFKKSPASVSGGAGDRPREGATACAPTISAWHRCAV